MNTTERLLDEAADQVKRNQAPAWARLLIIPVRRLLEECKQLRTELNALKEQIGQLDTDELNP